MRTFPAVMALAATFVAEQFRYDGYKVYHVKPSAQQADMLVSLKRYNHVDFWSPLRRDGTPVDIMVDPYAQKMFERFLERKSIEFDVLIQNVENVHQDERIRQVTAPRTCPGEISFTKYHRYGEISDYLDRLGRDHSDLVTLETIGKSYEGRDLKLIKISTDPYANKPVIFIDAGMHAREWMSPAVALYIINQLVENPDNLDLLDKVDYHILPVVNPDGYEYTHRGARNWRKTRSLGNECYGADVNRNFEFHWAEEGSSDDECDMEYHGAHAFSEIESVGFRDYVLRNKDDIKLYLSLHSHGQLILYPWGFTKALSEDSEELQVLGETVASRIESVYGTNYTVGNSTSVLYPAAGASDDWVKAVGGVELCYTIELPPKLSGAEGFAPLPSRILPIATETFEGIKVFNQYISLKFG